MSDAIDKAREDFFSEATDITEGFSRSLLAIDQGLRLKSLDPDHVNSAFRAIHTLKGLAGLFGAHELGRLTHGVEDLLDDLRLGRRPLSAELLDLLFGAVELFTLVIAGERSGQAPSADVEAFLLRLGSGEVPQDARPGSAIRYDLDPQLLAVLTEYEEHRLTASLRAGMRLYRLRIDFDLETIDTALEETKDLAKQFGEVITYLPTGGGTEVDRIELDVLVATNAEHEAIAGAFADRTVEVEEMPRQGEQPLPSGQLQTAASVAAEAAALAAVPSSLTASKSNSLVAEGRPSIRSAAQTVRVDIRRLDHLMNIVGSLGLVRSELARVTEWMLSQSERRKALELSRLGRTFERRLSEMQQGILQARLVPLAQIFDRLARVVRQLSRERGKDVRLVIAGCETEIDKLIVEALSDPLMHMMRNAIDHGIETSEQRSRVGKPLGGTIALNAYQKGNHVLIEIEDDGAGIDRERLTREAVERGLLEPGDAAGLSDDEKLALVFAPGLSTRSVVDDLSGRGVGMDVVKTNVARIGGIIDVQSELGTGTKLIITLPITLAIVSALLVRVGGETYAVALSSVTEALKLQGYERRVVDGRELMSLRGSSVPLCRLRLLFGLEAEEAEESPFVLVATIGNRRMGLVVDELVGQRDVVVKPLGPSLQRVRGFSGATELGDERVGLVLDVAALSEEFVGNELSGWSGKAIRA